MSKVKCRCKNCDAKIEKTTSEFNRNKRRGSNNFCNHSCSLSWKNKQEGFRKKTNENRYDITKHSDNNKDEFTDFKWHLKTCRQRDKECDLTLKYLKEVWDSQNGICPFTKKTLVKRTHMAYSNGEPLTPRTASVDRIDGKIKYRKGNVRFISVLANFARNRFTDEEVIEFCREVTEAHG